MEDTMNKFANYDYQMLLIRLPNQKDRPYIEKYNSCKQLNDNVIIIIKSINVYLIHPIQTDCRPTTNKSPTENFISPQIANNRLV